MGSLDKYLRKHKENLTVKLERGDYEKVVDWCVQVADAMEFLAKPENNIIHVRILKFFLYIHKALVQISFLNGYVVPSFILPQFESHLLNPTSLILLIYNIFLTFLAGSGCQKCIADP